MTRKPCNFSPVEVHGSSRGILADISAYASIGASVVDNLSKRKRDREGRRQVACGFR